MKFSIIVPARNEAENLKILLPRLQKALASFDCEIVVVDNGSTDDSVATITELKKNVPNLRLVSEPIAGYGRAVLGGLKNARGEILAIIRADNQESPEDLAAMCGLFLKQKLDLLKAVRRSRVSDGLRRIVISKVYNTIFQTIFRSRIRDINATPKVFTRAFYERASLESLDWFIDAEIVIKAEYFKCAVSEVEIDYLPRLNGRSNVRWAHIYQFLANMIKWGVRYSHGKLLEK
ncbi:MAG: glycosyltransferase family 2 protein [Candidatus Liptonbacteria bacterium]|nr:glycosyltransferase family 2 protein [Candidatus Liptonbacteria bacterium]